MFREEQKDELKERFSGISDDPRVRESDREAGGMERKTGINGGDEMGGTDLQLELVVSTLLSSYASPSLGSRVRLWKKSTTRSHRRRKVFNRTGYSPFHSSPLSSSARCGMISSLSFYFTTLPPSLPLLPNTTALNSNACQLSRSSSLTHTLQNRIQRTPPASQTTLERGPVRGREGARGGEGHLEGLEGLRESA